MISLLITTLLLNGVLSHEKCGYQALKQRALDNDKDGSLHKRLAEMEIHYKSERYAHEFNAMVRKGKDRRGLQEGITTDWDGEGFSTSDYFKGILEIPVVFHVLYNPNEGVNLNNIITHERIQSQIMRLNKDYLAYNEESSGGFEIYKANYSMAFKLHHVIRQETWRSYFDFTSTTAHKYSNNGGSNPVDPRHYLNLWVLVGKGADGKEELLGQCTFPGLVTDAEDGCTINYKVFGDSSVNYINDDKWKNTVGLGSQDTHGRTTTHEIGHFFNLGHIWGEAAGGFNDLQYCDDGDRIKDTPDQLGPHSGCPTSNTQFSTFSCGTDDMYMNYMDYSDDECMSMFTKGQLERSLSIMNQPFGRGRKELVDYQSNINGRFVNDLYFTVTSETEDSKICGPSDELIHNFGTDVGNKRVYACVSTTDNSYVDVIGDLFTLSYQGNNCIATLETDSYACYDKVSFTNSKRMTVDQVQQKLRDLFMS